jgi:hypothetical protein
LVQSGISIIKSYYGTGGDLNVDEIHEVIPMTEECGVWHPQEGVFNGHFKPTEADKINRIGQLRQGVVKVIENPKFQKIYHCRHDYRLRCC